MRYNPQIHKPAISCPATHIRGQRMPGRIFYSRDRHGDPSRVVAEREDGVMRSIRCRAAWDHKATNATGKIGAFRHIVRRDEYGELVAWLAAGMARHVQ